MRKCNSRNNESLEVQKPDAMKRQEDLSHALSNAKTLQVVRQRNQELQYQTMVYTGEAILVKKMLSSQFHLQVFSEELIIGSKGRGAFGHNRSTLELHCK